MLRALAALLPLLALVGCTSYHTDTFNIDVRNDTDQPITLSLAKVGRDVPYEPNWGTPEDMAIESPQMRDKWEGGAMKLPVLPPGKTLSLPQVHGVFSADSHGCLRAYLGEPSISEMLARGRDSPRRVEVPLRPGDNQIVLAFDIAGRLIGKPQNLPPPTAAGTIRTDVLATQPTH